MVIGYTGTMGSYVMAAADGLSGLRALVSQPAGVLMRSRW